MSDGGRWVDVPQPDGTSRRDWRPDDQPPSPDGGPGSWHVVTGGGQANRWEWIPAAVVPPPPPIGAPQDPSGAQWLSPAAQGAARSGAGATAPLAQSPAAGAGRPRHPLLPASLRSGRALVVGAGVLAALVVAASVVPMIIGSDGGSGYDRAAVAAATTQNDQRLAQEFPASFSAFQIVPNNTGGRAGYMQVSFTNNGTTQVFFDAVVEAVGPGGEQIAQTTTRVGGLDPGQTSTQTIFTSLPDEKLDPMTSATVRVTRYSVLPPAQY